MSFKSPGRLFAYAGYILWLVLFVLAILMALDAKSNLFNGALHRQVDLGEKQINLSVTQVKVTTEVIMSVSGTTTQSSTYVVAQLPWNKERFECFFSKSEVTPSIVVGGNMACVETLVREDMLGVEGPIWGYIHCPGLKEDLC